MNLFDYDDYKLYLKNYLKTLPKGGHGQLQKIATYLRVHPTHMSQVFTESKELTPEQALGITKYLSLGKIEKEYFLNLVHFKRSGTEELRQYYQLKLDEIRQVSKKVEARAESNKTLSESEKIIFYSDWLYSAIRLYCSFPEGQTLDSIEQKFHLSREKTSEIIMFLINSNLCVEKENRYFIGPLMTHLGTSSPFLSRHHQNWRLKSLQKSNNITPQELMFTGPFSLSKKDFESIRSEILELISKTIKTVKDSEVETLAVLNIDFFYME